MSKKLPKLQLVEKAKLLLDELYDNLKQINSLFSSSLKREELLKRNTQIENELLTKFNIIVEMKGA